MNHNKLVAISPSTQTFFQPCRSQIRISMLPRVLEIRQRKGLGQQVTSSVAPEEFQMSGQQQQRLAAELPGHSNQGGQSPVGLCMGLQQDGQGDLTDCFQGLRLLLLMVINTPTLWWLRQLGQYKYHQPWEDEEGLVDRDVAQTKAVVLGKLVTSWCGDMKLAPASAGE